MKNIKRIARTLGALAPTLVLGIALVAKAYAATPVACFFESRGCEAKAGPACGGNVLANKFEYHNSKDWMCNGTTVYGATACLKAYSGECCVFAGAATACPTASCPCDYIHADPL